MNKPVLAVLQALVLFFVTSFAQALPCFAQQKRTFKLALPGYKYQFPRDHASHDEFKTEWWYYTGHLKSVAGKKYGFELTFFRIGVEEPNVPQKTPWQLNNYYLAHFAITDENNKKFHYFEKLNRSGVNAAGAREDAFYVFNEGWLAEWLNGRFYIKADTPQFGLHLTLEPMKPPVVHGKDGVSQKAACKGCASHYYSMTRLKADGLLFENGKPVQVSGLSWMDHEFGSNQLTEDQVGWDWFSVQLNNGCELMLYFMRRADGKYDANSSGTFIDKDGKATHITLDQFSQRVIGKWKSPKSGGTYPMGWNVSVPSLKLELSLTPTHEDQELVTKSSTGVTYWEGSTTVSGKVGAESVSGNAYVEMTGYSERFRNKI